MNTQQLLDRADIWRGGRLPPAKREDSPHHSLSSGFDALDALLPGGGWPTGTLTEVLTEGEGVGALRLVLPALARMSQSQKKWIAWVSPPHVPYAPALAAAGLDLSRVLVVHADRNANRDWAIEQALRSGTCGAVLAWPASTDARVLRRLQLAAETGHSWGVLFRSLRHAAQPSPAAVRLQVEPDLSGISVQILKRRGGWATGPMSLDFEHALAVPASATTPAGGLHPGRYQQ
ncbi:MAG: translesion DNA synthesis-associated protein ImuA [Gammaproteobacteria bacterium]|jgi:hypothetical protein|nr:translesion DNA synthesis-associated protein ImuA [Gammaproteobacteria bacterium]